MGEARELVGELSLFFLHFACTLLNIQARELGGACRYARGTVEGTSQAEVPSTEGPLAVWHNLTARMCYLDLIALSQSNTASENVQLRIARRARAIQSCMF